MYAAVTELIAVPLVRLLPAMGSVGVWILIAVAGLDHHPPDLLLGILLEVAARLRDEISDLKKELRQMVEAGAR